jgi:hypothetical protein
VVAEIRHWGAAIDEGPCAPVRFSARGRCRQHIRMPRSEIRKRVRREIARVCIDDASLLTNQKCLRYCVATTRRTILGGKDCQNRFAMRRFFVLCGTLTQLSRGFVQGEETNMLLRNAYRHLWGRARSPDPPVLRRVFPWRTQPSLSPAFRRISRAARVRAHSRLEEIIVTGERSARHGNVQDTPIADSRRVIPCRDAREIGGQTNIVDVARQTPNVTDDAGRSPRRRPARNDQPIHRGCRPNRLQPTLLEPGVWHVRSTRSTIPNLHGLDGSEHALRHRTASRSRETAGHALRPQLDRRIGQDLFRRAEDNRNTGKLELNASATTTGCSSRASRISRSLEDKLSARISASRAAATAT